MIADGNDNIIIRTPSALSMIADGQSMSVDFIRPVLHGNE